jgi:MFS transporter, SP family, general alpha glucoside:H+ symporter
MASDLESAKVSEASHANVFTVEDKDGGHVVGKADEMLAEVAAEATNFEHELAVRDALRIYWRGVVFAVIITLTIIMRVYDIVIINSFFALPAFRNKFGVEVEGSGHQITAPWQAALGNASLVGQVIGAFLVAYPMEWFGRKRTLIFSLIGTSAFTFMQFFAPSIEVLTASEYLSGVIWGFYQVLIPTYSSEMLPTALRPYLAAGINVAYCTGSLILNGVTKSFDDYATDWGYRIPFALQWIWPAVVLPALIFTPESPWWLVRRERLADAQIALRRLSSDSPRVDHHRTLAMMQKTILYEKKIEAGSTVWQCFKGPSRRRTEIVIMIFFCQDFAGFATNNAYFFEQLNLSTQRAFDIAIGNAAIGLAAALFAGLLVRYFHRRPVFVVAMGLIVIYQFLVAVLNCAPNYRDRISLSWAQVGITMLSTATFQATIGPLAYILLTEVPSARLRAKTVGVAIAVDACCGIVTSTVQPYLINPGEANLGGKANFVWGSLSVISFLWCFFRLPETKYRTVEEIDYLFEHRVKTKEFRDYTIDAETLKNNLAE